MKPRELEIFNDFLIRHDAFELFYSNIDPLLRNYDFKRKETILEDLFMWGTTPQGIDYWKNLNILWKKELIFLDSSE